MSEIRHILYILFYILKYRTFSIDKRSRLIHQQLLDFKKNQSIFIHIPKNAGNSVFNLVYGRAGNAHITIKEYMSLMNKRDFNSYFKFAIVRNPYSRLESAYFYLKSGGRKAPLDLIYQKKIKEFDTFEIFVCNFFKDDEYLNIHHFTPQFHWLIDNDGNLSMDYIGRYEKIEEFFDKLIKKFQITSSVKFHNRTAVKKDIKYTVTMKEIINKVYAKDFEFFNYIQLK